MEVTLHEKVTVSDWDPARYINSKEDVVAYLEAALEENDPDFLLSVFGDIARSKGMTKVAKEMNLDRKGLYRALSPDGNPSFKTIFKLIDILGLQVCLKQKSIA